MSLSKLRKRFAYCQLVSFQGAGMALAMAKHVEWPGSATHSPGWHLWCLPMSKVFHSPPLCSWVHVIRSWRSGAIMPLMQPPSRRSPRSSLSRFWWLSITSKISVAQF